MRGQFSHLVGSSLTELIAPSAGWDTEPLESSKFSDYVMTFCNLTDMAGESLSPLQPPASPVQRSSAV